MSETEVANPVIDEAAQLQEFLYERYKHVIDIPDKHRSSLVQFSKDLDAAANSDDPSNIKRTLSAHILRNFGYVSNMKLPTFPLPTREEQTVHKFMDSCGFKTTISCVGGTVNLFFSLNVVRTRHRRCLRAFHRKH